MDHLYELAIKNLLNRAVQANKVGDVENRETLIFQVIHNVLELINTTENIEQKKKLNEFAKFLLIKPRLN
jgi:hypothetical protein